MSVLSFQTVPAEGETGRFTDIRRREETSSTNAEVLELARVGAPEGLVVVADHQTAGRGRRGRLWIAPPGSALLASVLLRPRLPAVDAHLVALAAALAASDACFEVASVRPALKWPNDLVLEDPVNEDPVNEDPLKEGESGFGRGFMAGGGATGKLAGILAQSLVEGDVLRSVVVGLGCNVTAAAATLPGAVCLEAAAGRPVDRNALLGAWLGHLDRWYASALVGEGGRRTVLEAYRRRCSTLGRRVRVELADGAVEGRAVDVADDGRLVVEDANGRREISAGDVVHLR